MPYRRADEKDDWHWCKNCTFWPESAYREVTDKPKSGLCPQCSLKDEAGMCRRK